MAHRQPDAGDDSPQGTQHLTGLLNSWANGDRHALDRLMPLAYQELPCIAHGWRGQQSGHTSIAMRQVLVNHAEASLADKRGGGKVNVPLEEVESAALREAKEVLAALGISTVTVTRDWHMARAGLARELGARLAGPL